MIRLICEGWRCNPHLEEHERTIKMGTIRGMGVDRDGEPVAKVVLSPVAREALKMLVPLQYTEHLPVSQDHWQCAVCGQVRRWGLTESGEGIP